MGAATSASAEPQPSSDRVSYEARDPGLFSLSNEGRILRFTCRSQSVLFPQDSQDIGRAIGLRYRIDDEIYDKLGDIPPLAWTLYADQMSAKQGEIPISKLIRY